MVGTKNMLASFSLPHETNPIYPITHSTNASGKRTTFKPHMFLSSCKKKLKTVVKASLALNLLEEEVKVDVSSDLKVTATVNVKISKEVDLVNTMMKLPWIYDSLENNGAGFQLVSTQLDPRTNKPKLSKESVKDWPKCITCIDNDIGAISFNVELVIDADFGEPGAILVRNNYDKEVYVENISLEGFFHFSCNSWIQPAHINKETRIFFANKAYLPSQTPMGLNYLRGKELKNKRGDGNGLRLPSDRIYDYDTYNDIGNPNKGVKFARPTLGGERNPHPRRCRTGRPSTNTDVSAEKPVNTVTSATYVPRDEALEGMRRTDILMGVWKGVLHNIPPILATLYNENGVCSDFTDLTSLYRKVPEVEMSLNMNGLSKFLDISGSVDEIFKFEIPKNMSKECNKLHTR